MGKYTVITFSPVQEFIEKSRKLRDLYGSSFIISYLAYFLAQAAEAQDIGVISPGLLDVARGTPNYIIFDGDFKQDLAQEALNKAWGRIVTICRLWLEEQFSDRQYSWKRHWSNWKNHAWEFFWGHGNTIAEAQQDLQDNKCQRAWIGINWEGDSSFLSGADAIAFPDMVKSNPKKSDYKALKKEIDQYYLDLSYRIGEITISKNKGLNRLQGTDREEKIKELGEAIISPREPLSIPELIKRLITLDEIADRINHSDDLNSNIKEGYIVKAFQNTDIDKLEESFRETNRFEAQEWTGWFLGDGDRMGRYLRKLSNLDDKEMEKTERAKFSKALMNWGENQFRPAIEGKSSIGRLVYAGGDDFMGVFSPKKTAKPLTGQRCWEWWQTFPDLWAQHGYGEQITVSVGFVWAAPNVPQREIIQNCHLAERMAKNTGRNRIAFRILFNSGNYLEWSCPWRFLAHLAGTEQKINWVNLYQDIAVLESRHSFTPQDTSVAKGIFEIYFGENSLSIFDDLWNGSEAGILGEPQNYQDPRSGVLDPARVNKALNDWVINLAKVGFHLFRNE